MTTLKQLEAALITKGTIRNYRILETLGVGGQGCVMLTLDVTTETKYAMKVIPSLIVNKASIFDCEKIQNAELAFANANIRNTFLMKYKETFMESLIIEGSEQDCCFLFMDVVANDLWKMISSLKQENKMIDKSMFMSLFAQCAVGMFSLNYLFHIIHRDLKPENILLDKDNQVKICDFGCAKDLSKCDDRTSSTDNIGTPSWVAPEIAISSVKDYTFNTDMYSLGCVFFHFALLRHPYAFGDEATKLRDGNPAIPEDVVCLLIRMLTQKAEERPLIEEVVLTPSLKKEILSLPPGAVPDKLIYHLNSDSSASSSSSSSSSSSFE